MLWVMLPESKFETLFIDLPAPLGSSVLLHQVEPGLFVKVPGSIKALEGPEKYPRVAPVFTKIDRRVHQTVADTPAAQGVGHDEPPQMRTIPFGLDAVNGNGTLNTARQQGNPEAVALLVVSFQES